MTTKIINHPARAALLAPIGYSRSASAISDGAPPAQIMPAKARPENTFLIAMASTLVLATLLVAVAISAAQAQDSRGGRYTMHKTDDGFVRLDTETGAIALCQKSDAGWGCKPISGASASPSEPQQFEPRDEVDRLARENADLKAEIRRLDELLSLRGNRDRPATAPHDFKLPTEQEVDQALNYVERMLRKFQERLKRFEDNSGSSTETQPDTTKPDAAKPDNKMPERRL